MFNFILALQDTNPDNNWIFLVILGVFLLGMLAFSVIPQRRKQKQMTEMNSRIKVGDKIRTIGGISGTVVDIDHENNIFTILSGTSTFEIDRSCVYSMEMMGISQGQTAPPEVKEEPANDVKVEQPVQKTNENAEKQQDINADTAKE